MNNDDATGNDVLLLLATDGSDRANQALAAGLRLVGRPGAAVLVTVMPAADPSLVVGSGHAGPVMSPSQRDDMLAARETGAHAVLDAALDHLATEIAGVDVETMVLAGDPGEEICREADARSAAGIVIGTRGQGGLKRALLGSVSDHVVRHAPCPVITVNIH